MAKIIAVAIQKGDPGKTTLVRNLGYALAKMGKQVLTVDFDAQANLSASYGHSHDEGIEINIAHLMSNVMDNKPLPAPESYINTANGVDWIGCNKYLTVVREEMHDDPVGADWILQKVLKPLRDRYDYILIDTGPSEEHTMMNALCASDYLLVPVDLQAFAVEGAQDIIIAAMKLKYRGGIHLEIAGIVMNRYEKRTKLGRIIEEDIAKMCGDQVYCFRNKIPQSVKIAEAHYSSKAVGEYAKKSPGANAFQDLAAELVHRCGDTALMEVSAS